MDQLDRLKNLVIMAAADAKLAQAEIALLVDRCSQIGLAEEDLEKAIEFALSDDAALQIPSDRAEQEQMLTDLLHVMAADGRLEEVEKRLFALAAAKMGFRQSELNTLIDRILKKSPKT